MMATEIERKFLVKHTLWAAVKPEKSLQIKQAYISTEPEKTIRVRVLGQQAFITIKGKGTGLSRPEFEYEIPLEDAHELIKGFAVSVLEKTRHYFTYQEKLWEVDVFEGENKGLIVAEIELNDEQELFEKPEWIDAEISHDIRYLNSYLSVQPFTTW